MKNIFYISSYYDYRVSAIRLLIYSYNKTRISENFSCTIIYKANRKKCKLKIYRHLSEDNTVNNILIFTYTFPIYIIINDNKIVTKIINKSNIRKKKKATVCIGKMINFYAYNMLIQVIESYIYLGVDHFIVYKTSCSENVTKVLNFYTKKGILEVYQFNKKFDIKYAKYKTYGQRIKLNDCLYRNLYNTENLIMTDLDEILWPYNDESIINMVERIEQLNNKNYDVYIFKEKIFMRNYVPYFDRFVHNIDDCDIFSYHICCDYTWRWPKLLIRNLTKVTAVSIHWVTGHLSNYSDIKIKPNIGYIRHTRRIYPKLIRELIGNWSTCRLDKREEEIKIRIFHSKKLIDIM